MTSRRQCWAFTPIHLIPPQYLPAVPTFYLYNPVCEMGARPPQGWGAPATGPHCAKPLPHQEWTTRNCPICSFSDLQKQQFQASVYHVSFLSHLMITALPFRWGNWGEVICFKSRVRDRVTMYVGGSWLQAQLRSVTLHPKTHLLWSISNPNSFRGY